MADETEDGTLEDPDAELVERALDRLKRAHEFLSDWRDEAREAYQFVAGDQWSEEDMEVLRNSDPPRAPIVFNRIGPVVDTVSGMEISNRLEVRYIPRGLEDAPVNELLTKGSEWIRDQSDAEDEESDGFRDLIITGMGWTSTRMDYELDQEGLTVIERVDPLEMYYDPGAKRKNLSDARYVFRVNKYTKEEFYEQFPDAPDNIDIGGNDWAKSDSDGVNINRPDDEYRSGSEAEGSEPKNTYWVIEYQWVEKRAMVLVPDPVTGEAVTMTNERFEDIKERLGDTKIPFAPQKDVRYMRAFIIGSTLLEQGELGEREGWDPMTDGFSYKAMTGKRDHIRNYWYGLVKPMIDPQRWFNKWLSQSLHILNAGAKGGYFIEADAIQDLRKFEEEGAATGSNTIVEPGAVSGSKIMPKSMAAYPPQLAQLMEMAATAVRDTTGVNLEILGMREAQQAASLEAQRKQAGYTILSNLFDALRRYRKEQGRYMASLMQRFIADGRWVRLTGPDGNPESIQLINDPQMQKFDVIVDDQASSPNQKEMVWSVIGQQFWQLPPQIQVSLMEYLPLPTGVVEKVKEAAAGIDQQAQQFQSQIQQLSQENADLKQNKEIELGELQVKSFTAQTERMRVQGESQKGDGQPLQETVDPLKAREVTVKEFDAHTKRMEAQVKKLQVEMTNLPAVEEAKASEQFGAAAQALKEAAQTFALITSTPKRVVRDENGMVIGVEPVETVQ